MLEVGRELNLGQEPLGADDGGKLGPEHLEGHPPCMTDVLGQIHGRHPACADLALEAIAVRQGGLEPAQQFGHGGMGEDGGKCVGLKDWASLPNMRFFSKRGAQAASAVTMLGRGPATTRGPPGRCGTLWYGA